MGTNLDVNAHVGINSISCIIVRCDLIFYFGWMSFFSSISPFQSEIWIPPNFSPEGRKFL